EEAGERGRGHGGDEGARTPARTAGGSDHAEAVEHAQGLADAGATDAELVREIAFGRQGVADCQGAGHDLLLDGVDDPLIGVRPGHRPPHRTRGRLGAVRSLLPSLVPGFCPRLSPPACMSCLLCCRPPPPRAPPGPTVGRGPTVGSVRRSEPHGGGSRPQDHLTQLTYRSYSHINGLTSLRSC